ncbi:MAG TPA: aminopeptidase [Gemmatimonadales bacterium]|nr:aminopeptidase [Gemmatimonadales bacterium]
MVAIGVRLRAVRRIVTALLALVVAGGAVAWCVSRDVRYVARAAVEEALILLRRRPIAAVVADPATDPATRAKLELVLAARGFAADSLHLAARQTYTTYSRVRRDTLVLVLTASRSDRLAELTWSYPVVGRVPYKGFFHRTEALEEARRLEQRGMDTYVRVSDAYSTLGWFNDPLLSTIVRDDSVDLAATVIHEILHNTIWVKGDVPFNESLADFVGYRGAEAFFRARGDGRNAERAVARWQDEIRLEHFYDSLAARLDRLYAQGLPAPAVRERRQQLFAEAQADLAGPVGATLRTIDGRWLARRPLNNAVVIAARLYRTGLDRFEALLAAERGDLVRTIGVVRERVAGARDPWDALGAGPGR